MAEVGHLDDPQFFTWPMPGIVCNMLFNMGLHKCWNIPKKPMFTRRGCSEEISFMEQPNGIQEWDALNVFLPKSNMLLHKYIQITLHNCAVSLGNMYMTCM